MIVPSLYRVYPISHTLYRIPRKFQNFPKFHKKKYQKFKIKNLKYFNISKFYKIS